MDAGTFVGHQRRSGLTYSAEDVLRRLRRCGVTRALVASFTAWQYDSEEGNRLTLEICTGSGGRLFPLGVVNPASYVGRRRPLHELAERGFKMVALLKQEVESGLDEFSVHDIIEEAGEAGLAVQVGITCREEIGQIGRSIRGMSTPVLIRCMERRPYAFLTEALALAQDAPNVMLDVSFGIQSGGVELLVESIGANRLFVASNAPLSYEACPYFQVLTAELSAEQRAAILDRNVERLLGLAPEETVFPQGMIDLVRRPKVDTLIHTGSCNVLNLKTGFSGISAEMSRVHTDVFVFSSLRGIFDNIVEGALETERYLDAEPRARSLVVVDPLRPEETLRQVARYRDDPRFVGLKMIQDDGYNMSLADERFEPILASIRDIPDWSILAHPTGLRDAAIKFPALRFVCEHSTWIYKTLHGLENVYFDISTSTALRGETDIAGLIDLVGSDRVLYASDAPLMASAFTLGKLWSLELDDEVLDKVLYANAFRAFPRLRNALTEGEAPR